MANMQFSIDFFTFLLVILINVFENESALIENTSEVSENEAKTKFSKLLTSIANVNEQRLSSLKKYTALDKYNIATGILRVADGQAERPLISIFLLKNDNPEDGLLLEIHDNGPRKALRDIRFQNVFQFLKEHHNQGFKNSKEISKNELGNFIKILDENGVENTIYRTKKETENDGKETSDGEEIINEKEMSHGKELNHGKENQDKINDEEISGDKEKLKLTIDTKMDKKEVLRIWKSCSKKASKRCKKACIAAYKQVCEIYMCSSGMKSKFKKRCKSECKDKFLDD